MRKISVFNTLYTIILFFQVKISVFVLCLVWTGEKIFNLSIVGIVLVNNIAGLLHNYDIVAPDSQLSVRDGAGLHCRQLWRLILTS